MLLLGLTNSNAFTAYCATHHFCLYHRGEKYNKQYQSLISNEPLICPTNKKPQTLILLKNNAVISMTVEQARKEALVKANNDWDPKRVGGLDGGKEYAVVENEADKEALYSYFKITFTEPRIKPQNLGTDSLSSEDTITRLSTRLKETEEKLAALNRNEDDNPSKEPRSQPQNLKYSDQKSLEKITELSMRLKETEDELSALKAIKDSKLSLFADISSLIKKFSDNIFHLKYEIAPVQSLEDISGTLSLLLAEAQKNAERKRQDDEVIAALNKTICGEINKLWNTNQPYEALNDNLLLLVAEHKNNKSQLAKFMSLKTDEPPKINDDTLKYIINHVRSVGKMCKLDVTPDISKFDPPNLSRLNDRLIKSLNIIEKKLLNIGQKAFDLEEYVEPYINDANTITDFPRLRWFLESCLIQSLKDRKKKVTINTIVHTVYLTKNT